VVETAYWLDDVVPKDRLFKHFGHNPYSGDLHYQCPACEIMLPVDPTAALGVKPLSGQEGLFRFLNRMGGRV
jgi:hypothetical protein